LSDNQRRTESARVLFKAGKARDGYYTNDDILAQVRTAMDILDKHYAGYTHVFGFDNVTTHLKRRANALSATHMVVNPPKFGKPNWLCTVKDQTGNEQQVQMDDGRFHDGTAQPLYFPDNHPQHPGRFKGMRVIVQERFLKGSPGVPNPNPIGGRKIVGQCKNFQCTPASGATTCCLRRILYSQSDFAAQKSALEEVVESRGYQVLFFPKFHCEVNAIEQSWGFAKRIYRQFPASSAEADLERNVTAALDAVPLSSQRKLVHLFLLQFTILICCDRFFIRSLRFMDAYRKGLNGQQAAWATKKYHGHRVLPAGIMDELDKACIE
jgi:hypothetical protein